jgi:hypothetical protein
MPHDSLFSASTILHIMKYIYCLAMLTLAQSGLNAQFLDYGNDPSRYRWNIVRLPHYKLIYPRGLDSLAFRYANALENVRPLVNSTMSLAKVPVFPVILHPGNMVSNGMVSWAPRRVELLTTPARNQHAQPWEQHLVTHESRHVFQTSKLMTGFFRPFYYIMGEQVSGFAAALVPRWFFEGDAVAAETGLSRTGRGRLPEFQLAYRTKILTGDFYSFDKWHLGSYRDYTGTFYTLGYDLVSFARYKYGRNIWNKTVDRYAARPVSIPPFSNAYRRYSRTGFNSLFKETFEFLGREWAKQDSGYIVPHFISPNAKGYTSYQYPQVLNDSIIICLKSGLGDINSIVALVNGKEKLLVRAGSISSRILLNKGKVYWAEYKPGLRWSQEIASVLQCLDPLTGKITTVGKDFRRIIDFAVNGRLAAVALYSEEGSSRIVLFDLENAEEAAEEFAGFNMPEGGRIQEISIGGRPVYASFIPPCNGTVKEVTLGRGVIYASIINEEGIALYSLSIRSGAWRKLMEETHANATGLTWKSGSLYFESGLNGINNVYTMNPADGRAFRITSSRFGAFQPELGYGSDSLVFADYQPGGYRIASMQLNNAGRTEADFQSPCKFTLAEALAEQEQVNMSAVVQPSSLPFEPKMYGKLSHLFAFHSWAPVYYNVKDLMTGNTEDFTTAFKLGFSFISQNALNTAVTQIGYYYANRHSHGVLNFNYSGLFPVFNLSIDYGGEAWDFVWKNSSDNALILNASIADRELLRINAQVYVPFNLNRNSRVRGLRPSVTFRFANDRYQQLVSRRMPFDQYLLSEILMYDYRRMATQDLFPRWGYQFRLQHLLHPADADMFGPLYAVRLTTYMPGIVAPHSLMLRLGYQYQEMNGRTHYNINQLLEAPRGGVFNLRSINMVTLKSDYAFPIVNPDFSIGSLAYIKRIRANLFYDISLTQEKINKPLMKQSSCGADILVDWNALRFYYNLTVGARFTRTFEGGIAGIQLISSMNF